MLLPSPPCRSSIHAALQRNKFQFDDENLFLCLPGLSRATRMFIYEIVFEAQNNWRERLVMRTFSPFPAFFSLRHRPIPDKSPSRIPVNGCLIEYKWFHPHFTANLFHLPLDDCHGTSHGGEGGAEAGKKMFFCIIIIIMLMIQTIIGNEHLKRLIQDTNAKTFFSFRQCVSLHTPSCCSHTITEWFICKYRSANGK